MKCVGTVPPMAMQGMRCSARMQTASDTMPQRGFPTIGRLAEFWRSWRVDGATFSPSLRKKFTPVHGKQRNPCTQNPNPNSLRTRFPASSSFGSFISFAICCLLLLLIDYNSPFRVRSDLLVEALGRKERHRDREIIADKGKGIHGYAFLWSFASFYS